MIKWLRFNWRIHFHIIALEMSCFCMLFCVKLNISCFCRITDRPKDKINYKLDAYSKKNLHQNFQLFILNISREIYVFSILFIWTVVHVDVLSSFAKKCYLRERQSYVIPNPFGTKLFFNFLYPNNHWLYFIILLLSSIALFLEK